MRPRPLSALMLLAALTAGCSLPARFQVKCPDPYVKCHPLAATPKEPFPESSVANLPEEKLPAELAAWKELKPAIGPRPGGISAVVGDSLYILASFGQMNYEGYAIKITDVKVLDKRVQVKAHFAMTRSDQRQSINYPKDYAKVPYKGKGLKELPVELKMTYDSAAFAYIGGPFEEVDPALLPSSLKDWRDATDTTPGGKAAVVGDYLYVMANAGDRMKQGYEFRLSNLALVGDDQVLAVTTLGAPPGGQPAVKTAPRLFARIDFHGATAPSVKVEFQEPTH